MTITISPKTEKEVFAVIKDYGYSTKEEFTEDALWHWVLELKKADFFTRTREIRKKMSKKGLTEKDILADFGKFRRTK